MQGLSPQRPVRASHGYRRVCISEEAEQESREPAEDYASEQESADFDSDTCALPPLPSEMALTMRVWMKAAGMRRRCSTADLIL